MRHAFRLAPLALATATAAACALDPFDATGKSCPCIEGYVCDATTQTCLPQTLASVTPPPPGPGPGPAGPDAAAAPDTGAPGGPRVIVSDLRPIWTAGNSVYWRWNVAGDTNDFKAYEIVTGASAEAVRTRAAGVQIFRPTENEELGSFRGTDRTLNGDPVEPFTVTDDHAEGTQLHAQVTAIDKTGFVTVTAIASAKTTKPTAEKALFTENELAGTSTPTSFVRSTDRPYRGRYCYAYGVACPSSAPTCFVQLQRAGINLDVAAMPAEAFANAYLELAIAGGAAVPSFYSEVMLFVGNDTCANNGALCKWRYEGFTFRGENNWRLIQVPLRLLKRSDNKTLTHDELKAQAFKLHAIGLAGTWANATSVRIDEVRIRW